MPRIAAELTRWLTAMPKAELHLHLDGSLRPETALELAREREVGAGIVPLDLSSIRDRLVAPARCRDQVELLRAFDLPVALLQDAEALARVTTELVEDVASDGTRYAEIRWAPSLHTERGLSLRDGIATVAAAARRASRQTGVEIRLITVALRTHDPAIGLDVARSALDFIAEGVAGFDLAGVERAMPDPRPFSDAFEVARAGGLGISCHAGEWGGPAQVWAALTMRPWRIAHGAPAVDDPELMRELRARAITLDLCPTSNYQVGIGRGDEHDPLPQLLRAGVPVTISTDDRTASDQTFVQELTRAIGRLGIGPDEILAVMRHAYGVAFLHHDEELRAQLLAELEAWAAEQPPPPRTSAPVSLD